MFFSARLGKLTNPELKAALLRVILAHADPASAAKLLQAAESIELVFTYDDDPILTGLSRSSPQALLLLIRMLARADLSVVSSSDRFRQSLDVLATSQQKDPVIRKASARARSFAGQAAAVRGAGQA